MRIAIFILAALSCGTAWATELVVENEHGDSQGPVFMSLLSINSADPADEIDPQKMAAKRSELQVDPAVRSAVEDQARNPAVTPQTLFERTKQ